MLCQVIDAWELRETWDSYGYILFWVWERVLDTILGKYLLREQFNRFLSCGMELEMGRIQRYLTQSSPSLFWIRL